MYKEKTGKGEHHKQNHQRQDKDGEQRSNSKQKHVLLLPWKLQCELAVKDDSKSAYIT